MNKHRSKTCTHCGQETHPQPQDYDHDTGYGHCYECLGKQNWYVHSSELLANDVRLLFWESRPTNNGELTSDDSHPKVIEVIVGGHLVEHCTAHKTKEKIREIVCRRYLTLNEEVRS